MKIQKRFSLILGLLSAGLLLASSGCMDDKPSMEGQVFQPDPEITLGPFMTYGDDGSVMVRFHTNVPCTAGVRVKGASHRVRRVGRRETVHAVRVDGMSMGGRDRCQILLDDKTTDPVRLPKVLGRNEEIQLVFLGGRGETNPLAIAEAAKHLAKVEPEAVFVAGGYPQDLQVASLGRGFFNPLEELSRQAPLFFLPDVQERMPRSVLPAPLTPSFFSRDFGCVHVAMIDAGALRDYRQRRGVLLALQNDLDRRSAEIRWTVLVTGTPLFGSREVNVRAIEALGNLLEQHRVDLVISGNEGCYHRSLPLQVAAEPPVRYLGVGGLGEMQKETAGREYSSITQAVPHAGLLTASPEKLEWKAIAADSKGEALDGITLYAGGDADVQEPPLQKQSVLSGAQAKAVMRREVVTIARQACRAVGDLAKPQDLSFLLTNPSSIEVSGQVFWSVPEDAAWRPQPEGMEFNLGSGYQGEVKFKLAPGSEGGPMPEFVVNMKDVGSTRQLLVLTPLRETEIYPAEGEFMADGLLSEPFWEAAARLESFEVLGSGDEPDKKVAARLAYNATGILVALTCELGDKDTLHLDPNRQPDDPVYHDESVEVFLDPQGQGRDYYQFALNASDVPLDRSSRLGLAWTPRWKHAVKLNKRAGQYTAEFLIPYQALGVQQIPTIGSSWRMNLTRNDYSFREEQNRADGPAEQPLGVEVAQWAQTGGSNANSGCYGVVRFSVRPQPGAPAEGASAPRQPTAAPAR